MQFQRIKVTAAQHIKSVHWLKNCCNSFCVIFKHLSIVSQATLLRNPFHIAFSTMQICGSCNWLTNSKTNCNWRWSVTRSVWCEIFDAQQPQSNTVCVSTCLRFIHNHELRWYALHVSYLRNVSEESHSRRVVKNQRSRQIFCTSHHSLEYWEGKWQGPPFLSARGPFSSTGEKGQLKLESNICEKELGKCS